MINKFLSKKFLTTKRKTFKLKNLIELYEHNYVKLISLIPGLRNMENFSFYLPEGQNTSLVEIKIIKDSKYTSTLYIFQKNDYLESVPDLEIEALIFNDLRMIEVKKINKEILLWSRYKYPNSRMFSKDEKYQWNYFFSQWLSNSLKEGLATDYQKKYVPL